ncbi:23S rRNA (pseudouridine(1915)-N(3))-methyltransferase RlmH [Candidatus Gracilibacteria bacterium]|nr:MAG: 23S rRNA (pseudouridine(1915)-N(3))-methyltransferase RlmH [Candidatus Gracilibacteria bacterium]
MIKIIAFVDSFKHYNEPILEFQKRLGKTIDFIKLKPSKKKEISEIIAEETDILKKYLEKIKGFKILLFINGKTLDSVSFSEFIEEKQVQFSDIVFIIGGAFGVDFEKISENIDFKFSFGPMTFPHFQAILMLFEQIYRAQTIKKGSSYHH